MAAGDSAYPVTADTTTNLPVQTSMAGKELDGDGDANHIHSNLHGVLNEAMVAVQTRLGTDSGTTVPSATAVYIGTGSGTSAWDTTPTFGNITTGTIDTTLPDSSSIATGLTLYHQTQTATEGVAIAFNANNSSPAEVNLGLIQGVIVDATAGGVDSKMEFKVTETNAPQIYLKLESTQAGTDGNVTINPSSRAVDFQYNSSGTASALFYDSSAEQFQVASSLFIGDTANGSMTQGLTINQGANDNEIFSLKSSDVGHLFTGTGGTDATTFYSIAKREPTGGGATVSIQGDANASFAIGVRYNVGVGIAADTTKSTSALGIIDFRPHLVSGNTFADVGANGNLMVIRNNATTRWILDAEGDTWQGGSMTLGGDILLAEGAVINWDSGDLTLTQAGNVLTLAGGYLELTDMNITSGGNGLSVDSVLSTTNRMEWDEISAPGTPPANSVNMYAVVDGGGLTDMVAKFQDGSTDIFAQETTEADAPQLTYPDGTDVKVVLQKPHPGIVRLVALFENGKEMVIKEHNYHTTEKVNQNLGARGTLPVDWDLDRYENPAALGE